MKTYQITFNCPTCKHSLCGGNPIDVSAMLLTTENKTAARQLFNETKSCKKMQILKIERWHNYAPMRVL